MVDEVANVQWALTVSQRWRPPLPTVSRRGPKEVYQDSSIMVLAVKIFV